MAGIHSLSGEVDPVGRGSQSAPQDSFNFSADRHSVKQDILSPCFYFGRHPISCPRRERGTKKRGLPNIGYSNESRAYSGRLRQ